MEAVTSEGTVSLLGHGYDGSEFGTFIKFIKTITLGKLTWPVR